MTDQELVAGLIERNAEITHRFFFMTARPMLLMIMRRVFDHAPDYDEIVNELYVYLIKNDCAKLRLFSFESSFMTWLKVVATRYFLRYRDNIVEDRSTEPESPSAAEPHDNPVEKADARIDIETLLGLVANERYRWVIRRLFIDEILPDKVAAEMGITLENLYNVKRRALSSLTVAALRIVKL